MILFRRSSACRCLTEIKALGGMLAVTKPQD